MGRGWLGLVRFTAGIGVACTATACQSSDTGVPSEMPACVVAAWGDNEKLTVVQVRSLATGVSPSPTGNSANEWALDVYLANWDSKTGAVDTDELLAAYGRWLTEHDFDLVSNTADPNKLRNHRDELHARANVQLGPCYLSESREVK